MQVLMGEPVDIVLSSAVECKKQVDEWYYFYQLFSITVDKNNDKATGEFSKKCYQSDIVYGTIEQFVADYLHHISEQKKTSHFREFILEKDGLFLHYGLQFPGFVNKNGLLKTIADYINILLDTVSNSDSNLDERTQFVTVLLHSLQALQGDKLDWYEDSVHFTKKCPKKVF